jgi:hypothetical protein
MMAAQPKAVLGYSLPKHEITLTGGAGATKLVFSADKRNRVQVADGTEHELPLGTKMMVTARRHCGDWYAEIEDVKHVAATGPTQDEAFLNALAKAA